MPINISAEIKGTSPIRNCSWGYKCEKTWDSLIATDNIAIRFCDACEKSVYLCITQRELADSVLLNRCVAFPPALLQSIANFESEANNPEFTIGEVQADYLIVKPSE